MVTTSGAPFLTSPVTCHVALIVDGVAPHAVPAIAAAAATVSAPVMPLTVAAFIAPCILGTARP